MSSTRDKITYVNLSMVIDLTIYLICVSYIIALSYGIGFFVVSLFCPNGRSRVIYHLLGGWRGSARALELISKI